MDWEQALRLKMEQRSLNFCALAERRRLQPEDEPEELGRGKKPARVSVPSRRAWYFCGRRGARDCGPGCGRPRPGARRLDWDPGRHRFGRVSDSIEGRALLLGTGLYRKSAHFLHLFTVVSVGRSVQGRARRPPHVTWRRRSVGPVTWRPRRRGSPVGSVADRLALAATPDRKSVV